MAPGGRLLKRKRGPHRSGLDIPLSQFVFFLWIVRLNDSDKASHLAFVGLKG